MNEQEYIAWVAANTPGNLTFRGAWRAAERIAREPMPCGHPRICTDDSGKCIVCAEMDDYQKRMSLAQARVTELEAQLAQAVKDSEMDHKFVGAMTEISAAMVR